jgi:hypothetical protein
MPLLEIRNRLLASLRMENLTLLARHLREVPIEQGEMLEEPGHSVDAIYFLQTGMISLIVHMPEDSRVEVGTVGSEGASEWRSVWDRASLLSVPWFKSRGLQFAFQPRAFEPPLAKARAFAT